MTSQPADAPIPPIVKRVRVDLPVDGAFSLFTDQIGAWWPLATHSVGGAESTVAFADGQIVESMPDGRQCIWGTVLRWQPPNHLSFTWHPGQDPEPHTLVDVDFVAEGARCLVTLTHSGWERIELHDLAGLDGYLQGWDLVLDRYLESSG